MGAFFSVIGIGRSSAVSVLQALKKWEQAEGDSMSVFQSPSGHSVILCDGIPADMKGLAAGFAHALHAPVIAFTYADDVVWSYELYTEAGLIDEFSSRPNYWEENADAARLAGNAHKVCEVWGGVSVEKIENLTNKSDLDEEERGALAYPDDKVEQWDGWQMCDFMRRLGLEYPVDEEGECPFPPAGEITVATALGLEQKAHIRRSLAELDEKLKMRKAEGKGLSD